MSVPTPHNSALLGDIAKTVLLEDEIEILVSVGDGPAAATAWT